MIHELLPRVLAHGIGGVQDLPVPRWLFYWGGAFVLVVSFILLGALWKTPQLAKREDGRDLGATFGRLVLGPLRILAQAVSILFFVVVLAAALVGTTDSYENIAPTFIYVVFWLGIPFLSLLLGNVWRGLSPWRALADLFVWIWERLGYEARPLAVYPERFGRYPGAVAILAFVALELTLLEPRQPARPGIRDRALLLRRPLRDARVRARDVVPAWGGLRRPVRLHRAHRAAPRPRRPDQAARCRSAASPAPSTCRARWSSSPSRSARSASTASAARPNGRI